VSVRTGRHWAETDAPGRAGEDDIQRLVGFEVDPDQLERSSGRKALCRQRDPDGTPVVGERVRRPDAEENDR
jgi:hypothetical protein